MIDRNETPIEKLGGEGRCCRVMVIFPDGSRDRYEHVFFNPWPPTDGGRIRMLREEAEGFYVMDFEILYQAQPEGSKNRWAFVGESAKGQIFGVFLETHTELPEAAIAEVNQRLAVLVAENAQGAQETPEPEETAAPTTPVLAQIMGISSEPMLGKSREIPADAAPWPPQVGEEFQLYAAIGTESVPRVQHFRVLSDAEQHEGVHMTRVCCACGSSRCAQIEVLLRLRPAGAVAC